MGLEADLLIDRRRLKRRVVLWRATAVVLFVLLAGGVALWQRQDGGGLGEAGLPLLGRAGGHVSRLAVEGFISDDRKTIEAIDRLAKDRSVRAVLVSIDSPGGTVAGGESLYAALQRVREKKPVVAVMRGTAASAGYMVSLPAERIFAREATLTGSIGVILQSPDVSSLLSQLGVRVETLASGPLKGQPSPFQPLTPEGRAWLDRVIADMYEQFVARVAAGRHMEADKVRPLADGRVLTGRQALEAGLVDAIGGELEARAWLAEAHAVPADLPVRDVETRSTTERLFGSAMGVVAKTVFSEWLGVDVGRLLWQLPR
jgi:protease-4